MNKSDVTEIPIVCPKCKAAIGLAVNRHDKTYLDDGIMLVRVGVKWCRRCGNEYHWHGDKMDFLHLKNRYLETVQRQVL